MTHSAIASPTPSIDARVDRVVLESGVRVLGWVAGLFASGALVVLIAHWWQFGVLPKGATIPYLVLSICVMAAIRRGQQRLAIGLFVWGMWVVATIAAVTVAGLNSPAMLGVPLVSMATGWLVGRRQGWWMAAACMLMFAVVGWLQAQGIVPNTVVRPPLFMFVILSTFVVVGALLGGDSMDKFRSEYRHSLVLADTLNKRVMELAISERRFATLFQATPLPTATTNSAGHILTVNAAWETLMGLSGVEVSGRRMVDLSVWVDSERFTALNDIIRRDGRLDGAAATLNTATGPREFLIFSEFVQADGEDFYVHILLDQTDRLAAEATQRELSERLEQRVAERTAQLQHAQDELINNEKLTSLGSMVAGISHELNTPIGNALTVASTLQDRAHSTYQAMLDGQLKRSVLEQYLKQSCDMADLIQRSNARAAELITSFKQVAIDQTSEQRRDFLLAQVVEDVLATLAPALKSQPYHMTHSVPHGLRCDSYPGPLGQILTTLVQNAVQHGFEGRSHGVITIEAENRDDNLMLIVADNGIGMTPATLAHVFDPFFTTKLGKGGSGLGLSVSHRLATRVLGGSLTVSSQPGAGTRFILQIPLRAPGKL